MDKQKALKFTMAININLTWSKIVAVAVLILAYLTKDSNTFEYAIPFVVVLITGKQFFNTNLMKSKTKDEDVKKKTKD